MERGKEEEEEEGELDGHVCFRSALKDYPFISTRIVVSVVTQREASRVLSSRDFERIMKRLAVPWPEWLSGLTDNGVRDLRVCVCV